jgi:hypothetical protein
MTMPTTPVDGPPLDPSSPEARQGVLDELDKGGYTTEPSPVSRFLQWLLHLLTSGPGGGLLPGWGVILLVAVVLAVLALVIARVLRTEPSSRRSRGRADAVDDEGLSAVDYRARARAATDRGDWDSVLLDSYRALAASAVERTLLTDLPGRTAHEVAVALEPVFPSHAASLTASAAEFDAVRYGHRRTTQALATATADLDTALQATRPTLGQLVGS